MIYFVGQKVINHIKWGQLKKNNIKNNINFLFLQQHNWSQKIWCNVVKK